MLTVNEIFHSIQGESTRAGERCVFVRLTACDLRCSWCDTPYAFHEGRKMELSDVLAQVDAFDCRMVEVTGGEPLLQKEAPALMRELLARGKTVLIETGGHVSLDRVPPGVIRIMDVKCPGSGEAHRMDWTNIERLQPRDEVKFVIADRVAAVLFSPVHGVLDARTLAEWVLADSLPVRVQLQVHKYIWSPETRGV